MPVNMSKGLPDLEVKALLWVYVPQQHMLCTDYYGMDIAIKEVEPESGYCFACEINYPAFSGVHQQWWFADLFGAMGCVEAQMKIFDKARNEDS